MGLGIKSKMLRPMQKIDAHQHFWIFDPVRDNWINDDMLAIKRDFLPADLNPVLHQYEIDGCIAVQASQTDEETMFLLTLAAANPFIKGVVGWVDLLAKDVDNQLEQYRRYDKLKGFRHVLQSEPDPKYMLQPMFINGIATLQKYGYSYDILIYPEHLPFAAQLAAKLPYQRFVVDHIAKPAIKDKKIGDWKKDIEALATHQNVYCKISGLLTEADWTNWKIEDFTPYLDMVLNAFGISRIMFGSDWPVCNLAGGYEGTMEVLTTYFESFSTTDKDSFWSGNAIDFYRL